MRSFVLGVGSLFSVQSFPAYYKPLMKELNVWWWDPEAPEENELMKQVSPALNIKKVNKRLFVLQSANGIRININESDQIVRSLRARGRDVPYIAKYNKGHGFKPEEKQIRTFQSAVRFYS